MRAVVHDRYGPPEVLRVAEVERPVPKEDEVLVRVHASTVTRGDAMGVRSADYKFTRVFTGIRRPLGRVSSSDSSARCPCGCCSSSAITPRFIRRLPGFPVDTARCRGS